MSIIIIIMDNIIIIIIFIISVGNTKLSGVYTWNRKNCFVVWNRMLRKHVDRSNDASNLLLRNILFRNKYKKKKKRKRKTLQCSEK